MNLEARGKMVDQLSLGPNSRKIYTRMRMKMVEVAGPGGS